MNTKGLFSPHRVEDLPVGYVRLYLAGLMVEKACHLGPDSQSPAFSKCQQHLEKMF